MTHLHHYKGHWQRIALSTRSVGIPKPILTLASCQIGELHTATTRTQQQHHSTHNTLMLRLFMSNLSMLDCYTILARCCLARDLLLRTLYSSSKSQPSEWTKVIRNQSIVKKDSDKWIILRICAQRRIYWETSWHRNSFFLLNARLWLWMMRLSSQAQQRPGKWLFSDGIKLHLS